MNANLVSNERKIDYLVPLSNRILIFFVGSKLFRILRKTAIPLSRLVQQRHM